MSDYTNSPVRVGGVVVQPGERRRLELPAGRLPTQTEIFLPVEVINGTKPGPRLWLSAAIHGDELNGLEIIHRILEKVEHKRLYGELICVPIVNVLGFIHQDRYLPDRRDLNRSFPGSAQGSLAARLAHLFMTEIVAHCSHGIDLHTASNHRDNLPQVRGNLKDKETRRIAEAFGAPCMIHGEAPRGSMREAVARKKIPIVVYEAGEPQRLNPDAINIGVKGVLRVMTALGMLRRGRSHHSPRQSMEVNGRKWIRARRSGILRLNVRNGTWISKGQSIGVIQDAFGDSKNDIMAPSDGLVIGHTNNPLVNQGDAMIHLATEVKTFRV